MLSRREFIKAGMMAGACAGLSSVLPRFAFGAADQKYNVLFIVGDDMRTTLGCYGAPIIKTPNMDKLAASGTLFKRAYCQQALCSPSRTSLMTGKRPDTTGIYNLQYHFRKFMPDAVTLPQQFMKHGYFAQGLSKIYHSGLDDAASWSVPHWNPKAPTYLKPESIRARKKLEEQLIAEGKDYKEHVVETDPETGMPLKVDRADVKLKGPAWESPDCPDNALADGMTADKAIECLREIKDKPFFLAVGFHKPHLPLVAPKKYHDLYDPSEIKLAPNPFKPKDMPEVAFYNSAEMRAYTDIPDVGPIDRTKARELIHAYYACVSYTDAQIGRVIGELERLGLREKTIIVLWGDHGWQLGEHDIWCKHTNFEEATRAPLIISVPGQKHQGAKPEALAEFVDIYPTLCDLAGLPVPRDLEGTSLVPIIEHPNRPWKRAAFSQYPRPDGVMGYSMRTDRYRYTEWVKRGSGEPPVGVELYDYKTDPQGNVNIAGLPESKGLVAKLAGQLKDGWRAARP